MPLTKPTKALLESLDSDPSIAAEDGAISFIIDDDVEIDILAAPEPDALVIRSVVGDVPPGAGVELYTTLLAANYNGLETKGAALALDTAAHQISLCHTVPTTEMTVATLTRTLELFDAALSYWRSRLSTTQDLSFNTADVGPGEASSMIRA